MENTMVSMRFKEKVCLVTGGTSGIGKATCLQFASEGARVIVLGRDDEDGHKVVEMIRNSKGEAIYVHADISRTNEIEAAVKKSIEQYGRIDVLVNNAAMMTFKPLVDLPEEDWDLLMATNLKAPYLFAKLCLPHMDKGAIINISSVHAHDTTTNVIPYAISKAGIESMARGMSQEYPPEKVRVNCIAPGSVDTPMLWSNPNVKSGKEKITGQVGKPEDIASAICFIASDEAAFINGATLIVDGGKLNML
jgi:glucose 1-dehydrogenase